MGRGTTRSVVEGYRPHCPRDPSTILRMVPLPIRYANREETRTAHNPPIVSIFLSINLLILLRLQELQRHQPPAFRPAPIIPSVPSQGRAQGLAILSRRERDEREGCLRPSRADRRASIGASSSEPPRGERQAPTSPASSREPPWGEHRPDVKGDGQGTRAVPGIGFARLRPARRRLRRQGVKSAAGPEAIQADSSRSDIPCGATSRSRNTVSQRSPGFAPGAPPALPHFPPRGRRGLQPAQSARPPPGPTSGRPEDRLRVGRSRRADDRGPKKRSLTIEQSSRVRDAEPVATS